MYKHSKEYEIFVIIWLPKYLREIIKSPIYDELTLYMLTPEVMYSYTSYIILSLEKQEKLELEKKTTPTLKPQAEQKSHITTK